MRTLPWILSVTVHGLILFVGGLLLEQAVVGISPGRNAIQVNLVGAPAEPTPPDTPSPPEPTPAPLLPQINTPAPPLPVDPLSPTPVPAMILPRPALPSLTTSAAPVKTTHSVRHVSQATPSTARDKITRQAIAGAIVDAEPDYLSNPPPVYPQEARDHNQEGVVVLDVIVSTEGTSETIKISSGSGYYLLDEAAREAVQHYRFRPATLEGIKVRSHVRVPIRFRLDD